MLSDSKSYVSSKSGRLARRLTGIQNLVDTTLQQPKLIIQTLEEALHIPLLYSITISTYNNESHLTEWEYDCRTAPDVFWKSVKVDRQDIIT